MEDLLEARENQIELKGFISFYKFENEQNGYRIASFKIDDNKQERTITIVGYFPHFNSSESLTIKGKLIKHKKFGLQVDVEEIYKNLPTSKENIIRLLASSQFKKIGKSTATKIYDFLGDDCISLLINNPNSLEDLIDNKIISLIQAENIKNGLKDFDYTSNAFQKLLSFGFSLKNIMKAEATYGENLDNVISTNPYQLIEDIDGIGFKTIDKLALSMGFDEHDDRRIKASIIYSLVNYCHQTGNTYLSFIEIAKANNKIIHLTEQEFESNLDELIKINRIIQIEDKYFHYTFYNAEHNISKSLLPFIKRNINTNILDNHFDSMIQAIEESEGISYSDEQKQAIYEACSNGLYIITGGPGTGKTTILNAILKMLKLLYGEDTSISLCAPTGRASKRMSYLSNNYACTIHRLLKWDLHSNSFAYNANNKLKTDVIIIDEFSMVDTLLFEALLLGTTEVSQIILIGDDAQIPSVGAGNLLYDLLQIKNINKINLSHIYRQNDGSNIVSLASNIRNSISNENFKFNNEVSFIKIKNTQASEAIIMFLKKLFEKGLTFEDIQIIIPMYGNVAGIDNINLAIQDWYNPKKPNDKEIRVNHQVFRVNDRVLQLKNQPEDDIFNGDIGVIIDIDEDNEEVYVEFDVGIVTFSKQTIINLTLAYAISIHKSQGSEFNVVLMCVFNDYSIMLNKKLIYTAVSRAKKSLIIFGDYYSFIKKSLVEDRLIRKTNLVETIYYYLNK